MRTASVMLLSFLVISTSFGQVLHVGNDYSASPNASDINLGSTRTVIDLARPAEGTGSVSAVKVAWSQSVCANAFKVKFFRRAGTTLTMTAERGPFNSGTATLALTPAVAVRQGDLIGVTKLGACGNPVVWTLDSDGYLSYPTDVTGSVSMGNGSASNDRLAVSGTGPATEWTAGIIPVVGSVAGGFGSQFRTSLQIHNHQVVNPQIIHGRFIFHRAGTEGSLDDPSSPFILGPGRLASYADIVGTLGQNGLGSLDVAITAGDFWPLIVARVYNDSGSAGTTGLAEDFIMPASGFQPRFLQRGAIGYLLTPSDMSRLRLNIGIRTWFSGAKLSAALVDGTGNVVRTVTKTYAPNWFEQVDAATFMGGPVNANQSIRFTIEAGSTIIYGSTTDNTTNDPAIQIVFASYSPS